MKIIFKKTFGVMAILALFLGLFPGAPVALASNLGTNIKTSDGTVYTITVENGITVRRPYTSGGAFVSYGFNTWEGISSATAEDLTLPVGSFIPPQDGKIICSDRGNDKGTCYLISGGEKIGFPSEAVFTAQGYSFSRALYGDTSFLPYSKNIESGTEAHKPGVLVNKDGTIYIIWYDGLFGFSDMTTFWGWGYELNDVVPANATDRMLSSGGLINSRQSGDLRLFSPAVNNPNIHDTGSQSGINLQASLSATSPTGNVTAGGKAVDLLRVTIKNTGSGEAVIKQLSYRFGGTVLPSHLSNLKIIYTSNTSGATQVGSNSGNLLNNNSIVLLVNPSIHVASGYPVDFILQADISNEAVGKYLWANLEDIYTQDAQGNVSLTQAAGLSVKGNSLIVTTAVNVSNSITLASPAGGEKWPIGSTQAIKWTGGAQEDIIDLYLNQQTSSGQIQYMGVLATNSPQQNATNRNDGIYNWFVPGTLQPGKYTIKACVRSETNLTGCSASDENKTTFEIVAANTTPSLNIVFPQPSAQLQRGQTYTISWNGVNLPAGNLMGFIRLYKGTDEKGEGKDPVYPDLLPYPSSLQATGTKIWTIPSDVALGNDYRIAVQVYAGETGSDIPAAYVFSQPFSIVSGN
ncbi:MAG: hypothetical protein WC794_03505 [Candidatus Doudnabacteria bacterium]|jgi:hypothetical protein